MSWDAIVIGSGIGGLAAAASLAHCGRGVPVLEQHDGAFTGGFLAWIVAGIVTGLASIAVAWGVVPALVTAGAAALSQVFG